MLTQNKTRVLAEEGKQEMFITREFNAPRELVFQAHADPDILAQWLGPENRRMKIEKYDQHSGGAYRYFVCDQQDQPIAAFHGSHHEVTAPERIIQTFEFEGLPQRGHVSLGITTFEALPGDRTKVTIHSIFPTVADRDATLRSGMEKGVNEGFQKLDALLEKW